MARFKLLKFMSRWNWASLHDERVYEAVDTEENIRIFAEKEIWEHQLIIEGDTAKLKLSTAIPMIAAYIRNPDMVQPAENKPNATYMQWTRYTLVNQIFNEFLGIDTLRAWMGEGFTDQELMDTDYSYPHSHISMHKVFEKMEAVGAETNIGTYNVTINYGNQDQVYVVAEFKDKLEAMYEAAIDFVNHYTDKGSEPFHSKSSYCPMCTSCGDEGCCSATMCKYAACYFGASYIKDHIFAKELAERLMNEMGVNDQVSRIYDEVYDKVYNKTD